MCSCGKLLSSINNNFHAQLILSPERRVCVSTQPIHQQIMSWVFFCDDLITKFSCGSFCQHLLCNLPQFIVDFNRSLFIKRAVIPSSGRLKFQESSLNSRCRANNRVLFSSYGDGNEGRLRDHSIECKTLKAHTHTFIPLHNHNSFFLHSSRTFVL